MGWAKYEEDNREARTERYASGNFFWTPYTSQDTYQPVPNKTVFICSSQTKQVSKKKKSYAYSY